MEIVDTADGVTVRLSRTEARIAGNSLNEVTHLIRIPESEYEDRLGGSRDEVAEFIDGFHGPQSIAADGLTFRLSARDLVLLRNAMREMTKGEEMEAWEYPTRLGAEVWEGRQLLAEVERLIEEIGA